MKTLVLSSLLGVLCLPLSAESAGEWVGYVTYAPSPVASSQGVYDEDWHWLKDVAGLLKPEASTLLGRRNPDHWMSFTDKGTWWLLQIHDETAMFNYRARIDAKTGGVIVEKGVDWAGSNRDADATRATSLAVGYVERARLAKDLFPSPALIQTSGAGAATHTDTPAMTDPHATSTSMHGDMSLGNGGTELWQRLVDGNLRFVSGRVLHPNQSLARVEETAKGQKPFAIVVTCSDSRVPPEVLFDQGLGDLFVIRTAGEVVTEVELGSIEYAVDHLGAAYLLVLGHERCGAVDATVKGGELPPNIEAIAAQIRPAVEAARFFKGDPVDNAVREHAKLVLAKIKGDPIVAEALHAGKLNLKAAYYDLDTGKVAALP